MLKYLFKKKLYNVSLSLKLFFTTLYILLSKIELQTKLKHLKKCNFSSIENILLNLYC